MALEAKYEPEKGSDKDYVRQLISDVGGSDGKSFIFYDDEINNYLSREGDVYSAAAAALRTMASNEAMVSKVIKFMELQTDGSKVAKALLETAKELEEKSSGEGDIDIIEMNLGPASDAELTRNRLQRAGL